ncbi:MAG: FAD-binding oxidoreductase, partial [Actinomycetota bacterium]|nr:FAD-binding oxidoreductase [Actinomycetota bacterium]
RYGEAVSTPSVQGEPRSFWVDTSDATTYPSLGGRLSVDVAVLGGGITGLAVAAHLKRAGMTVAVVEARRLCHGTTGHTTGKLTSLHGLVYDTLVSSFGEDGARAYGQANEAAIERVAALCEQYGIDCDFERLPNYTYTETAQEVSQIEAEVRAAQRAGLPAFYTEESDLPYPIRAAVRFDGQARFHPRKWCLGLAHTAGSPTRSIRAHPAAGGEVVLVSGESHKTGQAADYRERYARLERFARERLGAHSIDYRFSARTSTPPIRCPTSGGCAAAQTACTPPPASRRGA